MVAAVYSPDPDAPRAKAHLAVAAFLARHQGRTLDACRHGLRVFFLWPSRWTSRSWCQRPQIKLYVRGLEARGLALGHAQRR